MDQWTRLGIEAYQNGNRAQAQRFFRFSLMKNPDDVSVWMWMVEVADSEDEVKRCLEQVLKLEPGNAVARKALEDIRDHQESSNLPHVNPFAGFGSDAHEAEPLAPEPAANASSPFLAAVAEHQQSLDDAARQAALPFWRRPSFPRIAAIIGTAIAILAAIAIFFLR